MNRIHKKLWILLKFSLVPLGPIFGMKFTISCEFGPLRVKWWYHMFSRIKMEEYMESELSGIFPVKLVTKNIVRGSPGTQFTHMRVKTDIKYFLLIKFITFKNFWLHKIYNFNVFCYMNAFLATSSKCLCAPFLFVFRIKLLFNNKNTVI